MEGALIGDDVTIENAIVMENVVVESGSVVKGTREDILVVEA